jgi:MFS family permease
VVPDPRRWYALGLLCMAFFMVVLGSTSVFTAAPSIQRDLGSSVAGVQWVFTAYALSFGGLLLFGGRTADLLGRRRVFMAGVGLFVLSSLLCGFAWSGGVLIGARAVQGAAAAVMSPAALSLVMTTFEEGAERNKALGAWGAIGGIGATAGLLVGGLVTDGLGWQWVFFINVPVGLGMLALSPILLRENRDRRRGRALDPAGALTSTAALVLLVHAMTQAPEAGWAGLQTIGLLIASAALLALFVVEGRSAAPLLPLHLFRSRTLVGGNLVMVVAGMVLLGASCLLLARVSVDGSFLGDLFLGLLVFGLGMGAAFVAGSIASLAGVAEPESGAASGLQTTSFNIGTALGVAILSTVAIARTSDVLAASGQPAPSPFALTEGYQSAFVAAVGFTILGLVTALVLLGRLQGDRAAGDAAVSVPAHEPTRPTP